MNNGLLTQIFGSFSGAFFAFIFLRLAEFFSKLYERQVKNYNSLVNLVNQLNEIGGIINDNLYIIPGFIKTIDTGNVYFTNLHTMPINKEHYANLLNLEIINDLFSYNYQVRKNNDDIETVSRGYNDVKNALIQKNISHEDYKMNASEIAKNLKVLEKFQKDLQWEAIVLVAKVRVRIKHDQPLGSKIMSTFFWKTRLNLKKQEIEKEIEKVTLEIETNRKKSKEEIERVLGK